MVQSETPAQYRRAVFLFSVKQAVSITAIHRRIWGMVTSYHGRGMPDDLQVRGSLLATMTYGERSLYSLLLRVGAAAQYNDSAYVSRLLGCHADKADYVINTLGPSAGRKGFGL